VSTDSNSPVNPNRSRLIDLSLGLSYKYRRRHRSIDSPMHLVRDEGVASREARALEMLTWSPGGVEPIGGVHFRVHSATGSGFYHVKLEEGVWSCECPDWEERRLPCKHILRIIIAIDPFRSPTVDASTPRKKRYAQNWPAYDAGQQAEHPMFDPLLWDLLAPIPDKIQGLPPSTGGRPASPLRVKLLVAIKKVHLNESSRRAKGLIDTQCASGRGLLTRAPNYSTPSRVFNTPGMTEVLLDLLERSAAPLREIEDGGTVAIDSTGFCIECRGSYCTEQHNPSRRHTWVKAHLAVGTRTHIVLSARITDERGADSPWFLYLLSRVLAHGAHPSQAVADKAYLSRENLEGAANLGVEPFVPFKVNSIARAHSSPVWKRRYYEFMAKRDEFERTYHARSNIESVNSAIKRKLGEPLLSHNMVARFNELLAKLVAYNIGVIIHEIHEHGIDPGVPVTSASAGGTVANAAGPAACEFVDSDGNKPTARAEEP
jgi:hypothetical protein